jgi:hypothetical protein
MIVYSSNAKRLILTMSKKICDYLNKKLEEDKSKARRRPTFPHLKDAVL